jgi:hypothetical protein
MSNNITFDLNEYLSEEKRNVDRIADSLKGDEMLLENPSKKSVSTILSFSRALEVKTSKKLGAIENLLN